jgi:hypothetical protein
MAAAAEMGATCAGRHTSLKVRECVRVRLCVCVCTSLSVFVCPCVRVRVHVSACAMRERGALTHVTPAISNGILVAVVTTTPEPGSGSDLRVASCDAHRVPVATT